MKQFAKSGERFIAELPHGNGHGGEISYESLELTLVAYCIINGSKSTKHETYWEAYAALMESDFDRSNALPIIHVLGRSDNGGELILTMLDCIFAGKAPSDEYHGESR